MAKANVKVIFDFEKMTKNTIRFTEKCNADDPVAMPEIGTVYVPKATLSKLGWKDGKQLVVTVEVK